jgi:hypothetical protein
VESGYPKSKQTSDVKTRDLVLPSFSHSAYKDFDFFHLMLISVEDLEASTGNIYVLYNPSLTNDLVKIFSHVNFSAVFFSATGNSHKKLAEFCRNEISDVSKRMVAALPLKAIFCSVSSINITITSEIIKLLSDISYNLLQILGLIGNANKQQERKAFDSGGKENTSLEDSPSDSDRTLVLNSLMEFYEKQKKLRKEINCTTSIGTHANYLELPRFLEKCVTKKYTLCFNYLLMLYIYIYYICINVKKIIRCEE